MNEPIATLRFAIADCCGKNERTAYSRERGPYTSPKAQEFMDAVKRVATRARDGDPNWPNDPLVPKKVRVTVTVTGARYDAGAVLVVVKDGLEGVLFANDRIVHDGPSEPSDPRGQRATYVVAELLEVRSAGEIARLRDDRSVKML